MWLGCEDDNWTPTSAHPQKNLTKGKDMQQLEPETHTWLMKCPKNFSRFTAVGLATWLKLWCVHTNDCCWWWKKVPIWVILPVPRSFTLLDIQRGFKGCCISHLEWKMGLKFLHQNYTWHMYYSFIDVSINLIFVAVQEMSSLHLLATIKIVQFNEVQKLMVRNWSLLGCDVVSLGK